MKTTAFCEQDEYCQKVLKKHWPDVPIHNDIRELDGTQYRGAVDVVCGGFPCQPFSQAGKRAGKNDDRDLWPEMFRIIQEVQPSRVIGENVAGFVDMELDRTLADLEGSGYACQTFEIPACAVAAPHQRMRVWIVAYRNSDGLRKQQKPGPRSNSAAKSGIDGAARSLANASGRRCGERGEHAGLGDPCRWEPESGICELVDEFPQRVDGDRINANAEKKRPVQELRTLRGGNGANQDEWEIGGPDSVSQPEILQHTLHGIGDDEGVSNAISYTKENCGTSEGFLRELRRAKKTWYSSQRPELEKQRVIQFADALRVVSHIFASRSGRHHKEEREAALHGLREALIQIGALQHASNASQKAWQSLPDEEADWCIMAACFGCFWAEWPGVSRIGANVPNRAHRLRALGNAVVPQVVEVIGNAIMHEMR